MKPLAPLLCAYAVTLAGCGPFMVPGPGASDFVADFGNGYTLARTSGVNVVIVPERGYSSGNEIIDTLVIECDHDSRYILAKRLDLRSIPQERWGDAMRNPDPTKIDYWIIAVESKTRYGPLTETEFLAKRLELGVPQDLRLRDVYEYRKNEK